MIQKRNLILGIGFFVISIILFIFSFGLKSMVNIAIGPEFFPRLIAFITAIVSLVLINNSYKTIRLSKCIDADSKEKALDINPEVLKIVILMFLYALLLKIFGYIIMTTIYLIVHFIMVSSKESRKIPLFIIISLIVSISTFYGFREIFGVILPAGSIF